MRDALHAPRDCRFTHAPTDAPSALRTHTLRSLRARFGRLFAVRHALVAWPLVHRRAKMRACTSFPAETKLLSASLDHEHARNKRQTKTVVQEGKGELPHLWSEANVGSCARDGFDSVPEGRPAHDVAMHARQLASSP